MNKELELLYKVAQLAPTTGVVTVSSASFIKLFEAQRGLFNVTVDKGTPDHLDQALKKLFISPTHCPVCGLMRDGRHNMVEQVQTVGTFGGGSTLQYRKVPCPLTSYQEGT